METAFRNAVPADAPAMATLLVRAWQQAYRGILPDKLLDGLSERERAGFIRHGIETKPEFRYHVLEAGPVIVGVSVVCPCMDADLPGTAEIMVFYIHPDWQGQGLGRVMMGHTLAEIHAHGQSRTALWVLKNNHGARAFYKNMRFSPDGAAKTIAHLDNAEAVRYRHTKQERRDA